MNMNMKEKNINLTKCLFHPYKVLFHQEQSHKLSNLIKRNESNSIYYIVSLQNLNSQNIASILHIPSENVQCTSIFWRIK